MGQRLDFVKTARAEVGTVEEKENLTKYGKFTKADGKPWCGSFVMWCAHQVGLKIPNVVSTVAGAEKFKGTGTFKTPDTYRPQSGDLAFFDFPEDGIDRISHIGIVADVDDNGLMNVIEGNTTPDGKQGSQRNGGEVAKKRRAWRADNSKKLPVFVVGYGQPKFKD